MAKRPARRCRTFYSDLWLRNAGQRHPVEHVVLVKVDEATLSAYPDEPLLFWGPRYARATRTLREASATIIGLDFLFSASPEDGSPPRRRQQYRGPQL